MRRMRMRKKKQLQSTICGGKDKGEKCMLQLKQLWQHSSLLYPLSKGSEDQLYPVMLSNDRLKNKTYLF